MNKLLKLKVLRQVSLVFLLFFVLSEVELVFITVNFMLFTIVILNSLILLKHLNFGYIIVKILEIKIPIMIIVLYLKM